MEKLTIEKCGELLIKNSDDEYRSPCLGCESIGECKLEKVSCGFYKALEKLKDYEDLEEHGKLVKLPCKVGDTVYQLTIVKVDESRRKPVYEVFEAKVFKFSIDSYTLCFWTETVDEKKYQNEMPLSAFGKTVFLTRGEAEAALKGRE